MELHIKWRYPNETETHEHVFYDIDPSTVSISFGFLTFGTEGYQKHWNFAISHVVEMKFMMEGEKNDL